MEEKRQLTFKEKVAYSNWSAKLELGFPGIGCFLILIVAVIYLGVVLWFFGPEFYKLHFSGAHAIGKEYFARLFCVLALLASSYVTVYVFYFTMAFFDHDDVCRKHFLKYHYKSRFRL